MSENQLQLPELSLVMLIGVSGSGKSTFAKKHFKDSEIVSSDQCRSMVSDFENNQSATEDAFDLLNYIIGKRLKNGLLTVVDATNVQPKDRAKLVALARTYHALPAAIVLDLPEKVCQERNKLRSDRDMGQHVIRQQSAHLKRGLKKMKYEGIRKIHLLKSEEEVAAVSGILREKLYNDRKEETGPFDIIGDVHGCIVELEELLEKLGYEVKRVPVNGANYGFEVVPPVGRKALFLGDLVDRGPQSPEVLRLVMSMVRAGVALCVPGNHDMKLHRKLSGKKVNLKHGLAETMEQLEGESEAFLFEVKEFLYKLVSHLVLDDGRLVVAHAGLREEMQGRASGAVRAFCLFGESTGEIDEFGLPVRHNWAAEYRGKAKVVYGHTPVPEAQWLNRTLDIDTGCVFGGKLTALRYPEEELVAVEAHETYSEPVRPLDWERRQKLSHQQEYDDLLDIADVVGKRIVQTRLRNNITIREENAIPALEIMSRFAVNPKWLVYLPPTMSPCETSPMPDFLEHPAQAIDYYAKRGVTQLVCEEKHMGSRVVIVMGKDEVAVAKCFGISNEGIGVCYTRTGRNFFNDESLEAAFLERTNIALTKAGFWERFETEWVVLDCELMPWSAKAQGLLKDQYASVGAAASAALPEVEAVLQQTLNRGVEDAAPYLETFGQRRKSLEQYGKAYRHYCWPVESLADYKLAPFHVLATEGAVHTDKTHEWHMNTIRSIAATDTDFLLATPYQIVETEHPESVQSAIDWWLDLTSKGGEGMVVKPLNFVQTDTKDGLLQPAVKCRGSEYLRIIYGPEYDLGNNLERLKKRSLKHKRSMALREFALGVESLERFVRKEPLRLIHESVFAVLALESEEVDPRL